MEKNDLKFKVTGFVRKFHNPVSVEIKVDGYANVAEKGQLNEREGTGIQAFIKKHYRKMYLKWSEISDTGFYEGR